jgi:hypothetical protein
MANLSLHLRSVADAYQRCTNYLDNGRAKDQKKIGANTTLRREPGRYVIHYHNTDIIFIYPDYVMVDSGGWKTVTTKQRFNDILGFARFWSQKGLWHVVMSVHNQTWNNAILNKVHLFADGMKFFSNGKVTGAAKPRDEDKAKRLRKEIAAYATAYATALADDKIPAPSGGDCWYCSMRTAEGKTLGDVSGDKSHLISHIKESYYVPSLIANLAMERGGYLKNIGLPILWAPIPDDKRASMLASNRTWIIRDAKSLIRRSLLRRLGLAV